MTLLCEGESISQCEKRNEGLQETQREVENRLEERRSEISVLVSFCQLDAN